MKQLRKCCSNSKEVEIPNAGCLLSGADGRPAGGHDRPHLGAGAGVMSGGSIFGLFISVAAFLYLCYALFRGENL